MKKLLTMTCAAVMVVASAAFAEDAYIESAGSTGMDTGYHMKPSTRLELDFALTDADQSAQGRVFASYQQETGTGCSLYITSSKTWGVGVGSGTGSNWSGHWVDFPAGSKYYAPVDTIRHQVVYDLPNDRLVFATGSVTNWTHTTTKAPFTADAVYSLGLFAWPTTAAAMYSDPSKARIYGLKIYEAGELVHDFEPCMMDGLAGFRDSVTGKFIAGGKDPGSFTAGGDYVTYESPYVATPSNNYGNDQGSLYIDTQYIATQNTRCEVDYAVRMALPSDINGYYLFCGYGSTWYEVSINKNGFVCHNGGGWKVNILPTIAKDVGIRHTAVLDNVNDTLSVLTAGCTNGTVSTVSSGNYNAYTIKLAARYELAQDFAPIKIYGFRIYEAGELVRNFMPCSQDGVIGLKDAVTGLFVSYPPAKRHETAKSLEYGGEIAVVADPYIEGSGVNGPYIVTDYKPCGTTRAEIDFAQTAFDTAAGHYPFSIHATGTAFSFGVYTFASTQTYGYNCNDGNPKWHHSGMPTQTLARTTLILDAKNGKYIAAEARGAVTNKTFNISDTRTATTRSQYFLPVYASRQNTGVSDEAGGGSNPYPAESRMPMRLYSFRLYEGDKLVRDYVPAVKDGVAGLQDRLPGGKFLAPATGAFTYGGVFPVEVSQDMARLSTGGSATLTASAPGAASYRWLKNGEPIEGGTSGTLMVNWRKPKNAPTDAYQAVAVYSIDGLTVESATSSVLTIENVPAGMVILFK